MSEAGRQPARVGVYGATGYTGRFVAARLAERGHQLVLSGRNPERLAEVAAELPITSAVCPATIDDPDALQRFAQRCAVVVNCAGPFSRYGQPVAEAAIRAGAHYLDHTSEADYVWRLMRELDAPARVSGVVVVPGMSFFTALADLVANRLAAPMGSLLRVAVAYAVNGWELTPGSLATRVARAGAARVVYRDDAVQLLPASGGVKFDTYRFPPPLDIQPVIAEYSATCEAVTVPRHTRTSAVDVYMTKATFFPSDNATRAESTPVQPPADGLTRFSIVVDAHTRTEHRRSWISGAGDLYEVGALVSVEAAERLIAGKAITTGVVSPAEVFAEPEFLDELMTMRFLHGGLQTATVTERDATVPRSTPSV